MSRPFRHEVIARTMERNVIAYPKTSIPMKSHRPQIDSL